MNTLTKRLGWTLSFLALAVAIGFALRTPRTGVNALSWNVRQIIAERLGTNVASLTTNDLASITRIELHDSRTPLLTLPGWLSALERFVPDQKTTCTDDDLRHLDQLPALRTLYVYSAGVTDAGLVHLEKLSALQRLRLSATLVTDAGLVYLEKLSALSTLSLLGTPVTDAGLIHLEKLSALQSLGLSETQVTDAGLVHLEKLSALRWLDLRGTQVTTAGVARLQQQLPKCEIDTH